MPYKWGDKMIDTLTLKETFESNGFSANQASTLSHAMNELSKDKDNLATKEELHQVRNELKKDIKEVREELKNNIKEVLFFLIFLNCFQMIYLGLWLKLHRFL